MQSISLFRENVKIRGYAYMYMVNDRAEYDYVLDGIEDGALIVKRREWGKEREVKGHLLFEEDELIFAEITEQGVG